MTYDKRYYESHKEQWKAKVKKYKESHKEQVSKQELEHRLSLKMEVLAHYSSPRDHIIMCADPFRLHWYADPFLYDIHVLTLDHINGKGNEERRRAKSKGGWHFYRWLKQQGYPSSYQVLCMNCQFKKRELKGETK